jgi:hypothetical protein
MKAVVTVGERALNHPAALPESPRELSQISPDTDWDFDFETVHRRAETVTAVLEGILHCKFKNYRFEW